jgi:hypothetical protein
MSKIYFKGNSDTRKTPITGGANNELTAEICVGSSSTYSHSIATFEVLRSENEDGTYDFALMLDNEEIKAIRFYPSSKEFQEL